jgi:Triosephosphate isomerase
MPKLQGAVLGVVQTILIVLAMQSVSAYIVPQGQRHQELTRPYLGQTQHFGSRTPFITGNWKLNPSTRQEAVELASKIAQSVSPSYPGDVALFVPYPFIESVQKVVGNRLHVGVEVSC